MSYHSELDATIREAARKIADEIIESARSSSDDPIAWVTGNSYMPPLRSFAQAEEIWQMPDDETMMDSFMLLADLIDSHLDDANVALECPEYDNALYAVDLNRFEYVEDETGDTTDSENESGSTLQSEWRPIENSQTWGDNVGPGYISHD